MKILLLLSLAEVESGSLEKRLRQACLNLFERS